MDININSRKLLHIDISQANKIKDSDLEPIEEKTDTPQVYKPDKEAEEGQKKLSGWLDTIENPTNATLSKKKPTTFETKVKDAQDGKIKGSDFEKYLDSLAVGYKASSADSEGNYTISFKYNGNEYILQVNDPERAYSVSKDTSVIGKGSWSTEQLNNAGFKLPHEYFTQVYTNYYKFNTNAIARDLPGWPVNTLTDLQMALGMKSSGYTIVGNGSWNTQQINQLGLADCGKYFTGVYTNWYKFNSETIKQDFPGRYINTLDDLKNAIEDLKNTEISKGDECRQRTRTRKVDTDALFNGKEELTPQELSDNLWNLLRSNNRSTAEFAQIIMDFCDEHKIYGGYDRNDFLKCLIMLMNESAGTENSYPVTLTRDTIEKLNQKGIFKELDKIMDSDRLMNEYYFGVDGYIDYFSQSTGDCWLLSAVKALSSSEKGREIIKQSVQQDKETGIITVTLRGVGVSYDITPEELLEAKASYGYASGDHDVIAIEIATERYRREIGRNGRSNSYDNGEPGQGLNSGSSATMLHYLTGNSCNSQWTSTMACYDTYRFVWGESITNYLSKIYSEIANGNQVACFEVNYYQEFSLKTVDGQDFIWHKGTNGHAFAITGMTENTITIVNPWNSDVSYTFTWEEFAKIQPSNIFTISTIV